MQALRKILDRAEAQFGPGKPLQPLYALYEMVDTILFSTGYTTRGKVHARDRIDLKRMMITVVYALIPCVLMAIYNTGYQIHRTVSGGGRMLDTWQSSAFALFGLPPSPDHVAANFVHGALYFLPVLITTYAVGGLFEVLFAVVRKHEVNEGFLVTGMLIPLTLPATIPLWQVGVGTAFGIVIGKEIFGGTGMNFLNPALTARAFLFFAYPGYMSGEVWVAALPADGLTGATWLASFAEGSGHLAGFSYWDAFVGLIPGSMGETSTLAALIGAAILIFTRIGSWQTMVGVLGGAAVSVMVLNGFASETNPMLSLPLKWHLVLGGFAFGTVFMATDPVSSAFTNAGKLAYGALIGVLCILVRTVNPAYPEGMMLAILFMNMFAPLLDHAVVEANKRRRQRRYVGV